MGIHYLTVLSGCLERNSRSDARLDWVRVTNGHSVEGSHEVTVSTVEGETVVFEKNVHSR